MQRQAALPVSHVKSRSLCIVCRRFGCKTRQHYQDLKLLSSSSSCTLPRQSESSEAALTRVCVCVGCSRATHYGVTGPRLGSGEAPCSGAVLNYDDIGQIAQVGHTASASGKHGGDSAGTRIQIMFESCRVTRMQCVPVGLRSRAITTYY